MINKRVIHPTWIEIDLVQFKRNLLILRQAIGQSRLCLPVKANAYGHGLIPISQAAVEAGVDLLGVSCLQEGLKLREAGLSTPILVLGAIHEDQIDDLIAHNLEFTISSQFKADLVAKRLTRRCRIHLEVETGMQRTGVRTETAIQLIDYLKRIPCFEIASVYSHLAMADSPDHPIALQQIQLFQQMLQHPSFKGIPSHLASSGGLIHYPQVHFDMVRPGLAAFGYVPEQAPARFQAIQPCFFLKSRVSYFKVVAAKQGISYGHTYTTQKQTRIVTIPIGYGDGYRRALSNRGSVLIRGKRFPIAGTVCMDQFMVDVGDNEVFVGDEVVLIGKQGREEIKLTEIAQICDTIPYEILCLFNERIPRIYT